MRKLEENYRTKNVLDFLRQQVILLENNKGEQ